MSPVPLRVQTPSAQATSAQVILPGERLAVVGRGRDADVVVADSRVSRRHVELEPSGDGWTVRDLSANGIWCDGRRTATVRIQFDEVRLRLGAADGPELVLVPQRAAGPPAQPGPGLDVGDMATRLAVGGPLAPARPRPVGPGPAAVPAPVKTAAPPRWARAFPTLAWLAAAAFAVGALIALT
ncbi:FHA domain containing protein [Parafrankia sp. EAN1pec]|uniref:FHA domain-containing protein n=1 Tax=Parafrankia sp. (strain EAN1pec) TaxID=298653 RepID=UPI000054068E|nr:FHA domain containing protein [Frankia sp. EAN1pec]